MGGYTDAVLLDVNGDGDMEIAAVRDAGGARSLDIYDPVRAAGPALPGQSVGGVPWAKLYTTPLAEPVGIFGAGNLDPNIAGDEILLSARTATPGVGGSTVYRQALFYLRSVGPQDGTQWLPVGLPITSDDWSSVALGDMNGDSVDEIALVAAGPGTLALWQMQGPDECAAHLRERIGQPSLAACGHGPLPRRQ